MGCAAIVFALYAEYLDRHSKPSKKTWAEGRAQASTRTHKKKKAPNQNMAKCFIVLVGPVRDSNSRPTDYFSSLLKND